MPATERESPRAAIQNWLSCTDSNLKSIPNFQRASNPHRIHRSRYRSRVPDFPTRTGYTSQQDQLLRKKHRNRVDRSSKQTRALRTRSIETLQREKIEEAPRTRGYHTERSDRGGLRSSFRTLEHEEHDWCADVADSNRSRRRRNSSTSASSYLRPADDHRPEQRLQARETCRKSFESDFDSSSAMTKDSPVASAPPQQPALSFERRLRHKTREDRYECKQDKNRGAQAKHKSVGKKPKKRKRKEKSGAVVMHNFTAPNVSQDRLTLKPEKSVGLFGKGRASSPVRRKGLPDLAFSELDFLKSRHELSEDPVKATDSRKKRKTTKVADTDAEISRYFTATKPTDREIDKPKSRTQEQNKRRQLVHRDSAQPFVDLPNRPFLGFGTCGAISASPVRTINELDTRCVPAVSLRNYRSPTRSTSYLTWSQSFIGSQTSVGPAAVYQGSSKSLGCQREGSSNRAGRSKVDADPSSIESAQAKMASIHGPRPLTQKERAEKIPNREEGSASARVFGHLSHAQNIEHSRAVASPSPAVEDPQSRRGSTLVGSNTYQQRRLAPDSAHKPDAQAQARQNDVNAAITSSDAPQEQLDDPLEGTLETLLKQCKAPVVTGSSTPARNSMKSPIDQPERRESHSSRNQECFVREAQNHPHARESLPNDTALEFSDPHSNLSTEIRCTSPPADGSRMLQGDPDLTKPISSKSLYYSQTPNSADLHPRPPMLSRDKVDKYARVWKSSGDLYEQQQKNLQEHSSQDLGQQTLVFESHPQDNYTADRLSEPSTYHYTHEPSLTRDQYLAMSNDNEPYCNGLKDETQHVDLAMEYEDAENYRTNGHDYSRVSTSLNNDSPDIFEDVRNNATKHLSQCSRQIQGCEEFGQLNHPRHWNREPFGRRILDIPATSIPHPQNRTSTGFTAPFQGGEEHDAALSGFWKPNRLY